MTQEYFGSKIITAWAQEKDGAPGYAVKYEDGYTSWSPKDVFERSYLPIGNVAHEPLFIQRMAGEKAQNDDRLTKLGAFLENPISLTEREHDLLIRQKELLEELSEILGERLALARAKCAPQDDGA